MKIKRRAKTESRVDKLSRIAREMGEEKIKRKEWRWRKINDFATYIA